jgi:hypothetical protein
VHSPIRLRSSQEIGALHEHHGCADRQASCHYDVEPEDAKEREHAVDQIARFEDFDGFALFDVGVIVAVGKAGSARQTRCSAGKSEGSVVVACGLNNWNGQRYYATRTH